MARTGCRNDPGQLIAVDTSALMAIILGEPEAPSCMNILASTPRLLMSAGTAAEALIVAGRRQIGPHMQRMIDELSLEIIPVTRSTARQVAACHAKWGKGVHPAGLNFGDCFAYALAQEHECPLLFVGQDFGRTDVRSAFINTTG
jgi:ribonuclease VapC